MAIVAGHIKQMLLSAQSDRTPGRALPMTLGNAAAGHVRLIVWCLDCQHQVEPDPAEMAERYGAETSVPNWHARLVCSECGSPAGRFRRHRRQRKIAQDYEVMMPTLLAALLTLILVTPTMAQTPKPAEQFILVLCPDDTCHADHDDEWEPWIQCFRLELEWIVAVPTEVWAHG